MSIDFALQIEFSMQVDLHIYTIHNREKTEFSLVKWKNMHRNEMTKSGYFLCLARKRPKVLCRSFSYLAFILIENILN